MIIRTISAEGVERWSDNEWPISGYHRLDGPAIIYPNGIMEWWIAGTQVTKETIDWIQENNLSWPFNDEVKTFYKLTWGDWPFIFHDMLTSLVPLLKRMTEK